MFTSSSSFLLRSLCALFTPSSRPHDLSPPSRLDSTQITDLVGSLHTLLIPFDSFPANVIDFVYTYGPPCFLFCALSLSLPPCRMALSLSILLRSFSVYQRLHTMYHHHLHTLSSLTLFRSPFHVESILHLRFASGGLAGRPCTLSLYHTLSFLQSDRQKRNLLFTGSV